MPAAASTSPAERATPGRQPVDNPPITSAWPGHAYGSAIMTADDRT